MNHESTERLKPLRYQGPHAWLYIAGTARVVVLGLAGAGIYRLGTYQGVGLLLLALFSFAAVTSILCLLSLRRSSHVHPLLTWTQMLVDLSVVAATISFTGGIRSQFAFLMVIVILEAGLLLGLAQGFLFATLASLFMFLQAVMPPLPVPHTADQWIELWYRFLIQGLAFYLTAFISGYWNQRINRMEQFQRRILDNMNNGFLMVDRNGIMTVLNKMGHEILDVPNGSLPGKPVQQFLAPVSGGECPILTALRLRRDFISYEFQVKTGNGHTKLLGLTTSQIAEPSDGLGGIIVSFTDLTEMARLRQELQSQDRLAAVGELAAGLAHEIRNPVAAIRGALDELPANIHSVQLVERLTTIAIRESDHLNQIVTGFLNFARNPTLKREVFDLRQLAAEVKDLLAREHNDSGQLTISTDLPDAACAISGDRSQIKRVFVNLGENGIQAMRGRGTLCIRIKASGNSYEISFDDEGPGIEPHKISKIFEPFYTEREKGVGMGLAICLRIITAHDGTIRASSREGGGATMTVRLPVGQGKE
ncbi:MAG TPA: ATP-binding protein [Candidatus Bathyarchaeia archaeon]|nr:ATP-binding protein [Candidatus Bathyarchaeia archaeon]